MGRQRTRRALPSSGTTYGKGMLLVATDPAFEHHDTGPGHPERARRLQAALRAPEVADLKDAVRLLEPREATAEDDDVGARVSRWCRPGRIEDAKLGTRFVG